VDQGRPVLWSPRVQKVLHVGDARMLWRIIDGSHEPIMPVRQRRHDDESLWRNE